MFKQVDPKQNFPEMEEKLTRFWKENKIFEKSVENRNVKDRYVFYDGPPFITGTPHYGSLLPSIAKDVVPRYQTMKGHRVERVWGWDCHGLPIETKVEKTLGIKNRRDIEKFGILKFIEECYKYTKNTSAEWKWYIDKIARWVDFDNSYKTMDQDYMETVIWVFKQLMEKGLIYEGVRTSLYCTRCGTPISNFEIAMDNSYSDMEDPAVTVKFPITSDGEFKGIYILAWTTTPWTIPSNKALVLDPKETYVVAEVLKTDIELEQAFLVKEMPKDLGKLKNVQITQAYIENYQDESGMKVRDARIRRIGDSYEFTVKAYAKDKTETGQLLEKTRKITREEYVELIKKTQKKIVKTRYYYPLKDGLTAEIDVYQNNLKGLVVVEVEFPSISKLDQFVKPDWFGKEVSDSDYIWPYNIADKNYEEVKKFNDEYLQKPHNYDNHIIQEKVILAKKRLAAVLNGMDYKVTKEFKGEKLLGAKYEPPFAFFQAEDHEHQIFAYPGMANMEEGTGIVHSAPGFGDIDTEMGKKYNINIAMAVDGEGKFIEQVSSYAGKFYKDADPLITEDLKKQNKLFKSERIVHRFPYCYRCQTPLMQKAQPSWFINIQKLKPDLQENNKWINWVPDHLREGRFKKGIEVAPDWGISRSRFWATPMPVWQREEKGKVVERVIIGSRDELREKSLQPITKIVFVRHASRDKSTADGSLTPEGKKQAERLAKELAKEKFDSIYASPTNRAKETVAVLAKQQGKEVKVDEALGSIADRAKVDEISEKICKRLNLHNVLDAPEEILLEAFKEYIAEKKQQISKFLLSHQGEYIIAATHGEKIGFIRYLIEGRNLKDALAMDVPYASKVSMYFQGDRLLNLHRPFIDEIKLKGKTGDFTRVTDVLDVWMDSASMPYASRHYPFENKEAFEATFPADFVVEYMAQTRAWFYVMHVISTSLWNKPAFKNVVTTGVIFGTDGRKMSKSYGNYPDPKDVLEKYGAEPLRMYLMGSRIMVGEDMNFDEEGLRDQLKTFILPLWNSFAFLVNYANLHNWDPIEELVSNIRTGNPLLKKYQWDHIPFTEFHNQLDHWIVAKLQETIRNMNIEMDAYNIPGAVREMPKFVDDLSKWYIRRSRSRFASGDQEALATLYYVLVELAKLIAPITPFLAEELYQHLVAVKFGRQIADKNNDQQESIHLTEYPHADTKFMENSENLLFKMEKLREIVTLGQAIRVQNTLKVKQPLAELVIWSNFDPDRNFEIEKWMEDLLKDELNVKKVTYSTDELSDTAGWKKVENADGSLEISLNLNLTDDLKQEGLFREFVRNIQSERKKMGLQLGEKINLTVSVTDPDLANMLTNYAEEIKAAVTAETIIRKTEADPAAKNLNIIKISGRECQIAVTKV